MKLTEPDNPAPRKNYVQALVSEVVTAKERITVRGPVVSLVQALCSPDANCLPVRTSMENGAPDRIRTCGLCLRRAALYPAELRVPMVPLSERGA